MREDMRTVFARVAAEHQAKKEAREAEQKQADQIGASPEKGIVVPIKSGEEKVQERKKLAPNLKQTEQTSPKRVQPRPKNTLQGTADAAKPVVAQPKPQQEQTAKLPKRKARFEERYRRVTTYLENDVYEKVQELHESGEIDRINNLVNTAVKLYLRKYYSYGTNE
ncbi:hypothetical protein [Brevibacillus reuszeri]|uniref:hypothetical protein n=1 Tax=Brevibacillus TaxID=55080 RepID=UPI000CCC4480|nr:hypothetical protein [Brevibacillus reuszeri]